MHELDGKDFCKIRPVFQGIDHDRPAIYSLIEGNNSVGSVFVDDEDEPSRAFIEFPGHYVGGNEHDHAFNNELKERILTRIVPSFIASGGSLLITSFSDEWKNIIDNILRDYGVTTISRRVFALDKALFFERHCGWEGRTPAGYCIRRMDRELAEQVGVVGAWSNVERFLEKGFGFCVIRDDEIVSCCDTVFVGDNRAETSIETNERYRRQGFGTLATCAFIEHCLEQGIRPEWGTFFDQAAMMALKLGFVERPSIQISYVWFPSPSQGSTRL